MLLVPRGHRRILERASLPLWLGSVSVLALPLFAHANDHQSTADRQTIEVTLAAPSGGTLKPYPVEVVARPVRGPATTPKPPRDLSDERVHVDAWAPGRITLELPRTGLWTLVAQSSELWTPPIAWDPDRDETLTLQPVLAGVAVAKVICAEPEISLPASLTAVFRIRSSAAAPAEEEAFEGVCPVDPAAGTLACVLPAETIDLKLVAPGFTPIFHWDLEIAAGRAKALDDVHLMRGSSVAGWATLEDGSPAASAQVVLRPALAGRTAQERLAGRSAQLEMKTQVNHRGFYQLVGLEAGAYRLAFDLADYGKSELPLLAVRDREDLMMDDPFVIQRFPRAEIAVTPPRDPDGEPWTLLVSAFRDTGTVAETDENGIAELPMILPGTYLTILMSASGESFASEYLQLDAAHPRHEITIDPVSVVGTLELGGMPASGILYFGGRRGLRSIRIEADEEGRFRGLLPRSGAWDVDVISRDPPVERRLSHILVELDDEGAARVDISLPAATIEGRVVDSEGRAVADATVLVLPLSAGEKPPARRTDEQGAFTLTGLALGKYRLQALKVGDGGRASSARVELEIEDEDAMVEAEIVLGDAVIQTGRVGAAGGHGLAGAIIRATLPPGSSVVVPETATEIDGTFSLSLVPGVNEVEIIVMAPGYGLVETTQHIAPGQPWDIEAQVGAGGTLRLAPAGLSEGSPFVERTEPAARRYALPFLRRWAMLNGRPPFAGDGAIEIPGMPPGVYRFCLSSRSDREPACESGFLTEGNRLDLVVEMDTDNETRRQP